MGRAIGIDLGTTNSCAAVIENNQPKIIMYRGGSYTIPSLFAIDEGGRMLVGHDAKKQAALNPQDTVFAPKRLIGRTFRSEQVEKIRQLFTYDMQEGDDGEVLIQVKDQVFDLRQVSAEILKKIKEVAEGYLKEEVTNAVITVPAYFNDKQRQAVRAAGKLADLNVLRILNEPTAAALAYGLGKNLRQRLAVYDLGGGTFDISIIEIRDKVFEVVATGGDTFLGGIDFDDKVMAHVMETFMAETGVDLSFDRVAIQRLREAAERAKINLSSTKENALEVPFIARGPKGILNLDRKLTRDELESIVEELVGRTITTCERIFAEAKMSPSDIDEVLLVGGQSRMPLVQSLVKDYFGREPCKGVHPDEAVAVGAAIMAHSLTHAGTSKVTLLDVLPMPIGIAKVDRGFLPLFPKNCPIPHVRRLTLTNSKDDQKTIMLKIYQGESDLAVENELLGTFVFSGIRQMPRGQVKVDVWLNIDSEGILSLTAKDKQTQAPVDVHLKLKNKSVAASLALTTDTRGGAMGPDLEQLQAAAEERKKLGTSPGTTPPPPPEDDKEQDGDEAGDTSENEAATEEAEAPKRKGITIKSTPASPPPAPPAPAAEKQTASATQTAPTEANLTAPAPPGTEAQPPATTEGAQPPAAAEQPGCLARMLPWNWFK